MNLETIQKQIQQSLNEKICEYKKIDSLSAEAIAYALSARGKLVRSTYCALVSSALKSDFISNNTCTSLEYIHLYSLIHDDLPCMDDDTMRRGQPTAHIKFGEAQALLAGDGLLTDAFRLITQDSELSEIAKIKIIDSLAAAAGSKGMVLGQSLDLEVSNQSSRELSLDLLNEIHRKKTGALFAAACKCGVYAAEGTEDDAMIGENFGYEIGLAFQVIDDVIDVLPGTGKSAGKDLQSNKLTYLRHYDRKEALELANKMTDSALAKIRNSNLYSKELENLTLALCERKK